MSTSKKILKMLAKQYQHKILHSSKLNSNESAVVNTAWETIKQETDIPESKNEINDLLVSCKDRDSSMAKLNSFNFQLKSLRISVSH